MSANMLIITFFIRQFYTQHKRKLSDIFVSIAQMILLERLTFTLHYDMLAKKIIAFIAGQKNNRSHLFNTVTMNMYSLVG